MRMSHIEMNATQNHYNVNSLEKGLLGNKPNVQKVRGANYGKP